MTITHGNGIDWSTIHTHALSVIRFWNKNHWNSKRAKAFRDITFDEEVFYLVGDLFGVCRVGAVGCSVHKWSVGNEVNPVFNAPKWRKTWRELIAEHITCIALPFNKGRTPVFSATSCITD